MHSYFIFLITSEGDFIRLHLSCGIKQEEISRNLLAFWDAIEARLKELKQPYTAGDIERWRVIPDPTHNDSGFMEPEVKVKGSAHPSNYYPGRSFENLGEINNRLTVQKRKGWPY